MKKYTTISISGILTKIALTTKQEGYTEAILETLLPDDVEKWSAKKQKKWIKENNERMTSICDFLNSSEKLK